MLRPGPLFHPLPLALILAVAATVPRPHAAGAVVINELMSSNGATRADETGGYPDWFELFNPGTEAVDLTGWGVSDDVARPFKWTIRHGGLDAGGYLVVFASGKDRQPDAVAPLAPDALPGLELWLRAESVDPADATQVRATPGGSFVRRWRDASGHGQDAVSGNEASQPLWLPQGLDGHPALRFDGANDQLLLPAPPATNNFCLIAVFRTSQSHEIDPENAGGVGGVSGQRYLFGAQHGGDANAGSGLSVGTNGISVYEHGSSYMPALAVSAAPVGSGAVVVAVNYDERRVSLHVQGVEVRSNLASPRAAVTAPMEIGSGAYGAFGGDLAEVLLYRRALTPDERQGLARHFAARYGIRIAAPLHASFQLSAAGEELLVTRPDGSTADFVHFGAIARDVSWGRKPDGTGPFLFFATATPGGPNTTPASTELLGAPAFSHPGGFHRAAIDLALSLENQGATIRYTLDGAEPTVDSPAYLQPLSLRSRAGTPNDLANIPTVPGGPVASAEVMKGWVVRARAYKTGALPGPVVTRTFWIDARGSSRYTLPVISLATDRANFFDDTIGIYVPGRAPNGNYSQRGPEWERPVHVEFYEPDSTLAFAQEAGVKVHGNTSQYMPIKGLDLDGTSGNGRQPFKYRMFPDRSRAEFEHFLLRPSGQDQGTAFMRDELTQTFGAEAGAESQAARPCVVFVNGEYWGLHYLKEKEDAEFVAYYADHPADDLDYLEGYASPRAGDLAHYQAMIDFIGTHPLAVATNYADVQSRMEVASYIDYKANEIFFYRWDIGNHRLWRPRTPEGRWRWLQFDNDVSWGGFWAEQPAWGFNMLAADLTPSGSLHDHNNETTTFLLRHLMESPEFRRDFINRFQDLLNTLFLPSHTLARVDQLAAQLQPEMSEHTRRWRAPGTMADWLNNIAYLRSYATNRPTWARQQLRDWFGLKAPCRFSVSVQPENAGRVRLNSLELAPSTNTPWSGLYFQGHPVRLVALPQPGWRLAGWEGLPGVQTNVVDLLLNGDYGIGARFERDPEARPRFGAVASPENGRLLLHATARPGLTFALEASDDLVSWLTLIPALAPAPDGSIDASIPLPAAPPRRFYRLRGL